MPTAVSSGSAWAQNPPEPLLLGTAVRVLVSELNIRESPSTSAKRLDTFRSDQVILVTTYIPPVAADGYTWYLGTGPFGDGDGGLLPLPHDPHAGTDATNGWFAAMEGATPYVAPVLPRCPATIDVKNLGAMMPAERLACFGDRTIEFEGTYRYGCPTCEYFGHFDPAWLASPNEYNWIAETGTGLQGLGLNLRARPENPRPADGSILRIRGHFDDPTATECSIAAASWNYPDMELHAVPSSIARLWCRQEFVAESYVVVGTDPTFEGF